MLFRYNNGNEKDLKIHTEKLKSVTDVKKILAFKV